MYGPVVNEVSTNVDLRVKIYLNSLSRAFSVISSSSLNDIFAKLFFLLL